MNLIFQSLSRGALYHHLAAISQFDDSKRFPLRITARIGSYSRDGFHLVRGYM